MAGTVVALKPWCALVDVGGGVVGTLPVEAITLGKAHVTTPASVFSVGEQVKVGTLD